MGKVGGTTKSKEPARRVNGVRSVSDLIGGVGAAAFRRFGFIQHSIVTRWSEIVGERYANVSSPESIRFPPGRKSGGVLTLVVEGAHAPMLQHVAPVIVERVNRFFGYPAIERVSFRQGRVAVARKRPVPAAPPQPVPAELGESLREVADPELRAVLESLAQGLAASEGAPIVTAIPVIGTIGDRKR
ncbi:DciA family protein [Sphingosinicella sp. YJ22]|uniref:DUF721 domain-containing protein n=1 Tax=Sphingosinicella sp. YJ22 TaxID=1104780 RepID=UPI00140ADCE4|nr:DciA family protein [Sphingosinicella sp. YJ22]